VILLVAPLEAEARHLTAGLAARGLVLTAATAGALPVEIDEARRLAVARGGHGKAQLAAQTRHLLDHLPEVDLVCCAGAAGALTAEVAPGDVVVATETVEHDYTLRFATRPLPRFPGHGVTLARLRALAPVPGYRVHFGPVASGDEDVVDPARAAALAAATGALAVAWEGAGGARACAITGTPFVELRAVTDGATADAPIHFAERLPAAMIHLADLIARYTLGQGGS